MAKNKKVIEPSRARAKKTLEENSGMSSSEYFKKLSKRGLAVRLANKHLREQEQKDELPENK